MQAVNRFRFHRYLSAGEKQNMDMERLSSAKTVVLSLNPVRPRQMRKNITPKREEKYLPVLRQDEPDLMKLMTSFLLAQGLH